MKTRFETAVPLLLAVSLGVVGCTDPTIKPDAAPSAFDATCGIPQTFRMTVEQGTGTPIVSLASGYVIVNGEALRMTPAGSSPWGIYTYYGDVPHDGEVRYRYMFRYTSGLGVASGGPPSDHVIYNPHDRYIVRPVGQLTWSSPVQSVVPDDRVEEPLWRLPHRYVNMLELFPYTSPPFSGARSQTTDLILHNGYGVPINVSTPTITDRETGAAIPGLSIAHETATGSGYVLTIPGGGTTRFHVTAQTTISNGAPVFWNAGIRFPTNHGGAATCWYGPIWVEVTFAPNPP